jgi:hypothetical protein
MRCPKEVLDVVKLRTCWEVDGAEALVGTAGAGVLGACCRNTNPLGFCSCCAWLCPCRVCCKCALVIVSLTSVSPLDALTSDSVLRACAALLCRPRFLGGTI